MDIQVAKNAGFCFGVNLAVQKVESLLENQPLDHLPIYTFGDIINNPTVVNRFKEAGVVVCNSLDELENLPKGHLVIRSHGVGKKTFEALNQTEHILHDCSCPYVKKIHRIVERNSQEGYSIIIIGNKTHPEIIGIAGWSNMPIIHIESLEDIDKISWVKGATYACVAQTTYDHKKYEQILNKLQKNDIHVIINETICKATLDRQIEAYELAGKATKMIVIGGKNSSNTRKLYEICKSRCDETYYIETIEDLELNVLTVNDIIGITAGASTPKNIIEEVISNVRNAEF